jgi:hypothetical protein
MLMARSGNKPTPVFSPWPGYVHKQLTRVVVSGIDGIYRQWPPQSSAGRAGSDSAKLEIPPLRTLFTIEPSAIRNFDELLSSQYLQQPL